MTQIAQDDARRVLWHFGDHTDNALKPDRYHSGLITALLAATPAEYSRLARVAPSLAEAVGLALGEAEDFTRLVAIARGETPEDRGEPTDTERALATLHFYVGRFEILKMPPAEREAYADAVDKVFRYDSPEDFEPVIRWWHEDHVLQG